MQVNEPIYGLYCICYQKVTSRMLESDEDAERRNNKASSSAWSPIGPNTLGQKLGENTEIKARLLYVKIVIQVRRSRRQSGGPKALASERA